MWNFIFLPFYFLLATFDISTAAIDFESTEVINSFTFGSCNKQWKDNSIFNTIKNLESDVFVWTGDAYYTNSEKQNIESKKTSLKAVENGAKVMSESKIYQDMKKSLKQFKSGSLNLSTFGTWDDHDVGINDVGKRADNYDIRKEIYLDFLLGKEKSEFRKLIDKRNGIYYSVVFGKNTKQKVKFIVLDTRTNRDDYIFPSIPFITTLSNTLCRCLATTFGLEYFFQNGSILGKNQWTWLKEQLKESEDNSIEINIIISSIQVFTRNILTESWHHFPKEKQKLISILNQYKTKGLLILSGDVHVGQLIRFTKEDEFIEVTSSGLTHDCRDGMIPGFVCELVYYLTSFDWNPYFIGHNFGFIQFDWTKGSYKVSIKDKEGNDKLTMNRQINQTIHLSEDNTIWPFTQLYQYFITWFITFCSIFYCTKCFLPNHKSKVSSKVKIN